jgi:DNA-binding response OmpR family regulator
MLILIAEDDTRMAELLDRGLTADGHTVELAFDGLKAVERAQDQAFDAMILDVMLPGIDGVAVAKRLRKAANRVPILMLTARDADGDIVRGLDAGADDYLTKPFSFDVLTARLRALSRRNGSVPVTVLRVANLILHLETHDVRRDRMLLNLTRTEFTLLEFLMRRSGRVVSRQSLIETVWGFDRDVENNTLDVFISQLRAKTEAGGMERLIHTVRGFGYVIREGGQE